MRSSVGSDDPPLASHFLPCYSAAVSHLVTCAPCWTPTSSVTRRNVPFGIISETVSVMPKSFIGDVQSEMASVG